MSRWKLSAKPAKTNEGVSLFLIAEARESNTKLNAKDLVSIPPTIHSPAATCWPKRRKSARAKQP